MAATSSIASAVVSGRAIAGRPGRVSAVKPRVSSSGWKTTSSARSSSATSSAAASQWSLGKTTTVVSVYSGIALSTSLSTGSRTSPASAPPSRRVRSPSPTGTARRSSRTSGSRSSQTRTHLPGVTPGTYTSRKEGFTCMSVTGQGYRP